MTMIRCEPRRHSRSLSQSFHIMKTKVRHLVVLLGSSGNAHVVTMKKNSIHCNCPDCVSSCKHILFLAIACGFLNRRSTTATFSFASLLQRLHSPSPAPLLEAATLDPHTAKLCSVHDHSPCIHCARSPNSHPAATFIICSSCGFLAHQQCFDTFQEPAMLRQIPVVQLILVPSATSCLIFFLPPLFLDTEISLQFCPTEVVGVVDPTPQQMTDPLKNPLKHVAFPPQISPTAPTKRSSLKHMTFPPQISPTARICILPLTCDHPPFDGKQTRT